MQKLIGIVAALMLAFVTPLAAGERPQATMYKTPSCGCCHGHADYLRKHGFDVVMQDTHDLMLIKRKLGVPAELAGCHTTLIDGYVVEGHVPIAPIERLLAEKPPITGISLPGMPDGSPGMTGAKDGPFTIYAIPKAGEPRIFAIE